MNAIWHHVKLLLSVSSMTLVIFLTPNISQATEVSTATLDKIMARLDRLEAENAALKRQVAGSKGSKAVGNKIVSIPVAHVSRPELVASRTSDLVAYPKIETVKSSPAPDGSNRFVGAYGGLNVGYGWGLSNGSKTESFPIYDLTNTYFYTSNSITFDILLPTQTGISAFSNTGLSTINQGGIQGGLQIGYNLALSSRMIAGIESDVVGSSISANGNYFGYPTTQRQIYNTSGGTSVTSVDNLFKYFGGGNISAGVNWIGTTRARLGYMPSENLLLYVSGGLSYGGIYAYSTNSLAQETVSRNSLGFTSFGSQSSSGASDGRFTGTRFGYSAGGGIEWMFAQNFGLKLEAIYYNLGAISFATNPVGIGGYIANVPVTRITYDGIIGRTGINYHFNLE